MAKQLISADGSPYSVWQRRTRFFCLIMLFWGIAEVAIGITFVILMHFLDISSIEPMEGVVLGAGTAISGVLNMIVAALGLRGARDPKKITLFFWIVLIDAVMSSWQFAGNWSLGQIHPAAVVSLIAVLVLAACAWNVRGQTGYFDHHPQPGDD